MSLIDWISPTNSLIGIAFKTTADAFNKNNNSSIQELEEIALKADIEARIFLNQAKVEQE